MLLNILKVNAFDHAEVSNEPIAIDTELDSFNKQQCVDTPIKQSELNCNTK